MNLPNSLTMLRIILAVVFIIAVRMPGLSPKIFALIIFALAALTDWLDGKIAKLKNLVTDFGKFMDPIADKILILSAFIIFIELGFIESWMVIVIIARESIVTGLRFFALSKGEVIAASRGGKHKTVSQIVAIFVILLSMIFEEIMKNYFYWHPLFDSVIRVLIDLSMFTTVTLTVISGISYLWANRKIFHLTS